MTLRHMIATWAVRIAVAAVTLLVALVVTAPRNPLPVTTAPGPLIVSPAPTADPLLDTWPVGTTYECKDADSPVAGWCEGLLDAGLKGLDDREPGHPALVSTEFHMMGMKIDAKSGKVGYFINSGPCCSVLVITLVDGTRRAIGVGSPGGSGQIIAVPWEVADPSIVFN